MANYYTQFSALVPYSSDEQRDWLLNELEKQNQEPTDDDEFLQEETICEFQDEPEERGIICYAEEVGNLDALADIVCKYQRQFKIEEGFILEAAFTCSKPRLNGFGGLTILCYRGEAYFFDPSALAQEKLEELKEKKQ